MVSRASKDGTVAAAAVGGWWHGWDKAGITIGLVSGRAIGGPQVTAALRTLGI